SHHAADLPPSDVLRYVRTAARAAALPGQDVGGDRTRQVLLRPIVLDGAQLREDDADGHITSTARARADSLDALQDQLEAVVLCPGREGDRRDAGNGGAKFES